MKKILLGLGGGIIALATPALTIVSCSGNDVSNNITPETNKKYESVFTKDGKNLLLESFKNQNQNPLEVKTEAEVQKIADDKLNSLTSEELKNILLNQVMAASRYYNYNDATNQINTSQTAIYDVTGVEFNQENKKASFMIHTNWKMNGSFKGKNALSESNSINYLFKNIELKAGVINSYGKILPAIFIKEQSQDSRVEIYNTDAYIDVNIDKLVEMMKIENPNMTDNEIQEYKKMIDKAVKFENKIKNIKNHQFKLKVTNGNKILGDNELRFIDNIGFNFDEKKEEIKFHESLIVQPIIFSKLANDNKSVEWEIYKLSDSNSKQTKNN